MAVTMVTIGFSFMLQRSSQYAVGNKLQLERASKYLFIHHQIKAMEIFLCLVENTHEIFMSLFMNELAVTLI